MLIADEWGLCTARLGGADRGERPPELPAVSSDEQGHRLVGPAHDPDEARTLRALVDLREEARRVVAHESADSDQATRKLGDGFGPGRRDGRGPPALVGADPPCKGEERGRKDHE